MDLEGEAGSVPMQGPGEGKIFRERKADRLEAADLLIPLTTKRAVVEDDAGGKSAGVQHGADAGVESGVDRLERGDEEIRVIGLRRAVDATRHGIGGCEVLAHRAHPIGGNETVGVC
jgi:hypothetical protein